MRKLVIGFIIICIVVVLALAIAPQFIDANRYHDQIQAELQDRLGRPVTLGRISLSLLPPSLQVQNVSIGEDPNFGPGPFATTQDLSVRVALLPLLHKDVQIQSLKLVNPKIALVRAANGEWNYSTLGQKPAALSPAKTPPTAKAPKPPKGQQPSPPQPEKKAPELSLAHLTISNGDVHLTDAQNKYQATYNNIDVTLDHFEPGKPFDVDATVHIAGKGDQLIRVKGTAGPLGSGIPPFEGSVDLKQIAIADLRQIAQSAALNGYNGVISGSMKANTTGSTLDAEGSLKVSDPQIRNVALGYPISLDFRVNDDLKGNVLRIEQTTLHLGPTPVALNGTINSTPTPAQIDLRVTTSNASLGEIGRLAAATGMAFNAGTKIDGQLSGEISARGTTTAPALSGNIRASNIDISGGSVKQAVRVPEIELALSPTNISSNPFSATTGGTTLNVQFNLQNYTTNAAAVNAKLQTANANIGELLSIARAYGVSTVEGLDGSGKLSLNVTASGPMKNSAAMQFSGNGQIQNASLKTQDLAKPLNIRSANLRFSQNSMLIEDLNASLDQTNASGSISIRNFAAPQLQFNLNADKIDLAALQQMIGPQPQQNQRAALDLFPRAYAAQPAPEPGILTKTTGSGTVSIGQLTYDQLVLQNVKSQVSLDHGVIRLSPLTSTLYGGQQSGSIIFDTRVTPAAVNVSSKLQKVDANKLVSSVTSLKETIYGMLAANANTSFRAASAADMAKSLSGTLNLDLSNGRIAKIDLLNQLSSIGRFVNPSLVPQQPFTDVTKLTGTFNVVNGLAQTNDLRAVIPGANLAANGAINLATNALNMHVTAVLSKEFSQKVGGSGIGGFMQTALANKNGELVMPILVTGTMDKPMFAPDVQQVAQMKLQNLVPSFNNPGNLTSGLLGAVLGGKKNQQQGGVGGIINAITGQQQQNQAGQQNQDGTSEQQQANPVGDLLNQVLQGKQKKK
jgi:uncharacterized protein involved in outer membrane biogenesis